ncbi:4-carboxymuconolactone decarboxylase [Roseovarius pacificus]|uniref:4-carboxymuconolactone decarboxylase n=1 Tax=Roseovarius pacificus TaxID=337701 RepID=A0A1M7AGZ8_9RHOB|nr:carboxymuconolactone decarboxylase family protein [Roseovarius pacificus]GGO53456.1 4-carboxymuconolactone decarboxylase [Roseovarius pacificus]SHL42073.1 4-carboxymuconolactone decarboxylase [Roseovarius pacificus]
MGIDPKDESELFNKGLGIRRDVLGAAHVERSLSAADDFTAPVQRLVTEYCWGEIWGRSGLPRETRSIINLAMLSALNRPHEVRLHVRGALNNGVSRETIQEIILQVAIYCGVPAALDSMKVCTEVFREMDEEATASN